MVKEIQVILKINRLILFILFGVMFSEVFDGLTLISAKNNPNILLVNNELELVNSWINDTSPFITAYLNSDSTLIIPCQIPESEVGGRFKMVTWEDQIIWDYILPQEICIPHHDIAVLPNGNILAICTELKSQEEAQNKGLIGISDILHLDMIVEIDPIGIDSANIVWEWHFWDHLIQDINPSLENYGIVSEHPELLDINVNGSGNNVISDWNHCNSISYNSSFDQIIISSRKMDEFYVIDHSTSIEEAANHDGGIYDKGGDFLYRWGNPMNYGRGSINDKILFDQHGVDWIPDGYLGAGNILLFNNNHSEESSAVLEIENVADDNGFYFIYNNDSYLPLNYSWIYESNFYSPITSGAYRLPNGNTIITCSAEEYIFEVSYNGELEWQYHTNMPVSRAMKYSFNFFTNDILGDINEDNIVDILDIVLLVNFILSNEYNEFADINIDGNVDILDVVQLVNIILR